MAGDIYACSAGAEYVHAIAEGLHRLRDRSGPAEVMLPEGTRVQLVRPAEVARAHELVHVEQQAEHAPRWMRRLAWLIPLRVRAWWGEPEWRDEYWRQHLRHGYLGNPLELEARQAEETTTPGVPPP